VRITQEAVPTLISKFSITFSFSSVFWIDASSDGTITQGLKGICNLPAAKSSGLDGSPESALHWIGLLKENYIIVFDNADVLSPAQLEIYFPPPGKRGNILITSRNAAMQCLTLPENSLEVTEMEENHAIELLLKASCLDPHKIDFQADALEIVKELCYLPLAIDQAGAYIASGVTTIGEYLAKYSDHRRTLLSHSEFTGASKYNRSVYGTWELSYKEIQKRAESDDSHKANAANSAMLLLELFPFFHHEGITEEIFSYAALPEDEKTCSSNLPCASSLLDQRLLPLNKSGVWDNFVFREGLWILLSFSLIKKGSSDCVYAMHPLVHTWGRDRLTLNKRTNCCLMAFVTLSCSLRWDTSQPYGFRRVLVTHVRENMEYFKSEGSQNIVSYMDDAHAKFGRLLQEQGYFKEGETLLNEVLDTRKKILGVEHPDTITAMANLAAAYRDLGKYTEAENLDIQVLDERTRILGVEHPDIINAMLNLAATYHELGKYTEAEKLKSQVVDARMRILGVEHPDTITAIQSLAVAYHELGKYTESERLKIQVLDARNRILGPEHPETINTMGNLAATYRNLERYTEAEKLEIQVLDARNRILGAEHPETIRAMANLTKTYRSLKKYTEAEKLDIQVLDARNRILGAEHPETIRAVGNLAATYHALGKYTEAEKLEIQVLDARNRILGVEHPETIRAMADLAVTYGGLEKYTEAEKLEIQVLDARNRILGVEHPDTILAMKNLAITYRNLEKYTEAEKLENQAHKLKGRVPGAESHIITTMANIQEVQEIQVLDVGSSVVGEEYLHSKQVVLNHPVQAVLPDTTMNPEKKRYVFWYFLIEPALTSLSSVHFLCK
jgi:tetratricopeptide (TPR) repeat protein